MPRTHWLVAIAVCALAAGRLVAADALGPATAKADADGVTLWYDVRALGVEGQGWQETKAPFDRLPANAEGVVRQPVWDLSRHAAGLCVRFVSDATTVSGRWALTSDKLAMPHVLATGVGRPRF